MKIENEVRLLEIERNNLIQEVENQGGTLKGVFNFKRYVYDFTPINPNKWILL